MTIRTPIASWRFNGALTDSTGNGRSVTNTTGSYVPGRRGLCRKTGAVIQANHAAINALAAPVAYSASLWFFLAATWEQYEAVQIAITKAGSPNYSTQFAFLLNESLDGLGFQTQDSAGSIDLPLVGAVMDDWNHGVYATDAAGRVNVYLNGQHQFVRIIPRQSWTGAATSGLSWTNPPAGVHLDDCDLWDVELTPVEVAALFAGERP